MPPQDSIAEWIRRLKTGDDAAAQALWERYFERLVRLARRRLGSAPRRAADEEDVASSAFKSLCLGARRGRFPLLSDRDNLWGLLVVITARKAADLRERERRKKRGGGKVRGESVFEGDGEENGGGLEAVIGREPTPEALALLAEEHARLLESLGDPTLRRIAVWKMEGFTNEEIAQKLDCALRTVARKLALIRRKIEDRLP